ncbi:MAG: 3-hydroxyacyl-CoA dehydrogenase NAD-binding domain-containing protein, partial [Candidatus Heimdallarchaeota archaeon]|nr:3-hydroxyacyl-CoA dehydrogenase NAD-binding domain-containing protein [Candidatus Heimdallarchaeota archaeon]
MTREINTILVLGVGGAMGNGIAHVAASVGYNVHGFDLAQNFVDKGISSIKSNLERGLKRGSITEDEISEIMGRIKGFTDLKEATENVDFVIEAVFENIEIKIDLYQKLNDMLPNDVIIASNTSTISISLLGGGSNRGDRFIGMHFFNPPPVMKLVEIITGLQTSQEVLEITLGVAHKMGKETIVAKDSPGFIVNRVLVPMLNEAVFLLQEGIGSAEDIDKGVQLGLNHPMGPLRLLD